MVDVDYVLFGDILVEDGYLEKFVFQDIEWIVDMWQEGECILEVLVFGCEDEGFFWQIFEFFDLDVGFNDEFYQLEV